MVAYVGSSNAQTASSVTSLSVSVPTGVLDGEAMIMFLEVPPTSQGGPTPTLSGWSAVTGSPINGGTGSALYAWTRKASSEPGSYSISFSAATTAGAAVMIVYKEVDTTTFPATQGSATGASATSVTGPSLTGVATDGMVVLACGSRPDSAGTQTNTIPSPWTTRESNVTSAGSTFPAVLSVAEDIGGSASGPSITVSAASEVSVLKIALNNAIHVPPVRLIQAVKTAAYY